MKDQIHGDKRAMESMELMDAHSQVVFCSRLQSLSDSLLFVISSPYLSTNDVIPFCFCC